MAAFIAAAHGEGIAVYLLTGDPAWGLDGTGDSMAAEIDRAAGYGGLRGVMMDVEPYLTQEWEADAQGVMGTYVEGMTRAREAADAAGLELVACIPYFYDSLGHAGALETLVEGGCHVLAVMSYDKKDEAENLETEAALARARGRPLIMIYELQPPGPHDLTEGNTYYNDGLGPLIKSWGRLRRRYGPSMSYALHEYESLREVLKG